MKNKNIALIHAEDDKTTQALVKEMAKASGISPESIFTFEGIEGDIDRVRKIIEKLSAFGCRILLLSDNNMPGVNGAELVKMASNRLNKADVAMLAGRIEEVRDFLSQLGIQGIQKGGMRNVKNWMTERIAA